MGSDGASTAARLEHEAMLALVRSGREKQQQGKRPNRNERLALVRYERLQMATFGEKYLVEFPKRRIIELCARQPKQLIEWADRYSLPFPRGRVATVDLRDWLAWIPAFLAANWQALRAAGVMESDPLLASGDSPALERYRAAKADIAEDDRDRKRGDLLPADAVRGVLQEWSGRLRQAGEQLGRRHGPEAQSILINAIRDCEKILAEITTEVKP